MTNDDNGGAGRQYKKGITMQFIIIGLSILFGMVWLGSAIGLTEAQNMQGEIVAGSNYVAANPLDGLMFIVYIIGGILALIVCSYILRWCLVDAEHRDEVKWHL
jgi:hypothetical protein